MERIRSAFSTSVMPAIALATLAVLIAALAGAVLLYDGAYFLFRLLDSHNIEIPHLRMSFGLLQWPAIWVAESTESLAATRFVFGLTVMAAPPIALALCWWIVRKCAPWLIVWPALGILLVNLPGQMHWIATSIRTNQLFWPLLLAIFIGMPDRVVPLAMIVLVFILFMHPQVIAFLVVGACAALFLAWLRKEQRQRLTGTAVVLIFSAVYRYGIFGGGYEAQEASLANQMDQWQRSVLWLPLVALISVLVMAILLVLRRFVDRPWMQNRQGNILLIVVATVGTTALIVWASNATWWRYAIDYRGPSMWHSLILMGIAFLDLLLRENSDRPERDSPLRIRIANIAALVFCVVIALQSLGWTNELNKIRTAAANSDTACIVAETLPGFENSPLNFWSLPATSLGMQTTTPEFVVLSGPQCEAALIYGRIPIQLNSETDTAGRYMNLVNLRSVITGSGACWSAFDNRTDWHALEMGEGGVRRWNSGSSSVIVMISPGGQVKLTGVLDSLQSPNEVKILVNGVVQRSLPIETDRYTDLSSVTLTLEEGRNAIEFLSMRPASTTDGDNRQLAIAVIDLEFWTVDGDSLCGWRNLA